MAVSSAKMTRRPVVLAAVSVVIAMVLNSCGNGLSPMARVARVAKCFQRHDWVVVKRTSSTLDVRQSGDEVVLNFQNAHVIHAQILGDAVAMKADEECTSARTLHH